MLRDLFLAVSIVLLIACANVAGLLLLRAIRRRDDYVVRLALGARSAAIIRQSVFEGLLLGVTGALVGLAFAAAAIRISLHVLPDSMPRIDSISMDASVAGFALLLALATGALCSLAPAFAALRTDPLESLKEGVRTNTASSGHTWLGSGLVVSEIAIALVAKQGTVEDWIVENRSNELHAFHIHQLHFLLLDYQGRAVNEPFLRDTVNVPYL